MLDALLHIGRLDSGPSEMHVEDVALGPLLRRLRDEFAPSAEAKGLTLRVVPSSAVVRSDATYLRRILQNLIANAVRYTEAGRVVVGVRRSGGTARVEVLDTGPGIEEADLEAVFEEFRRLRAAGEGMGLGLAIVERACGLLGHPLEVASEPGRGSRFAVGLPLAPARRLLVLLVGRGGGGRGPPRGGGLRRDRGRRRPGGRGADGSARRRPRPGARGLPRGAAAPLPPALRAGPGARDPSSAGADREGEALAAGPARAPRRRVPRVGRWVDAPTPPWGPSRGPARGRRSPPIGRRGEARREPGRSGESQWDGPPPRGEASRDRDFAELGGL